MLNRKWQWVPVCPQGFPGPFYSEAAGSLWKTSLSSREKMGTGKASRCQETVWGRTVPGGPWESQGAPGPCLDGCNVVPSFVLCRGPPTWTRGYILYLPQAIGCRGWTVSPRPSVLTLNISGCDFGGKIMTEVIKFKWALFFLWFFWNMVSL